MFCIVSLIQKFAYISKFIRNKRQQAKQAEEEEQLEPLVVNDQIEDQNDAEDLKKPKIIEKYEGNCRDLLDGRGTIVKAKKASKKEIKLGGNYTSMAFFAFHVDEDEENEILVHDYVKCQDKVKKGEMDEGEFEEKFKEKYLDIEEKDENN